MHKVNDPVLEGHAMGDRHCKRCTDGFPKPCPQCGGLLHGELEQIEGDGQMLASECENCHRHPE